jgi:pyrroline-5-carboxylate reductase
MTHIAFIGAGNMAMALAGCLRRRAATAGWRILAIDPGTAQLRCIGPPQAIKTATEPSTLLNCYDVIVWAVKPHPLRYIAKQVAVQMGNALRLSLATGIRLNGLAQRLGTLRVVRTMPNTPALVGFGVCGLLADAGVSESDRRLVEQVLESTGELFWVDSDDAINTVPAITGSRPAYVFHFLEGLANAAQVLGFSHEQARSLSTQKCTARPVRRNRKPPRLKYCAIV